MKTFEHEFTDSGALVVCRRVSPFIAAEARGEAQRNKPMPEVRTIEEDGPLKGTTEEVIDEPYIERVRQWERKSNELLMQFQIKRAVVKVVEPADWVDQVAEFRLEREEYATALLEINPGFKAEPLPADDLLVFILYIACATQDDLNEFVNAISRRSYPTPEVVEATKESFRADLQK